MHINRRVRRIYKKYRTTDPFVIAKLLKIIVLFLDLPSGMFGYCRRILRRKVIAIDNKLSETMQVYVCAHELAHIILHNGIDHYFIKNNTLVPIGRYERQANQFAVHLLAQGQAREPDEPLNWFLSRCGIPEEMHQYY